MKGNGAREAVGTSSSSIASDSFISASLILTRCDHGLVAHDGYHGPRILATANRFERGIPGPWVAHLWFGAVFQPSARFPALVDPPRAVSIKLIKILCRDERRAMGSQFGQPIHYIKKARLVE